MTVFSRIRQEFKHIIYSTFKAASPAPTRYQVGNKTIDVRVERKGGIPDLAKRLELTGKGVEIGVMLGDFSELILSQSNLSLLYSIDPWQAFSKEEYYDGGNAPQEEQNKRYQSTVSRLSKFKERSIIIRKTSKDAVTEFDDGELDFIFIDGNHGYKYVKEDLHLWWPKVREGGLFSGDDYLFTPQGKTPVKDAVDEFMREVNQKFYLTTQEKFPRWYCLKGV
ncbi:MAG TPA: hypothetical protein DCF68_13355 [Cyanothece sp. UBA12306]|nr:hypothetical protein [Cyanothece sp. UBA12306]